MNRFEVGKWYRYIGTMPTAWKGVTNVRQRVVDKKPRLCTAVNDAGDWCAFNGIPPNVNHPEGLWDWTDNIEYWQEVSVTVIDGLVVYNCPVCGKPPKVETEVVYTKKYRSLDTLSKTVRTYSCCGFMVSGTYPKVLDSWNTLVGMYLENRHTIVKTRDTLEKMLAHTKKYPKELYNLRDYLSKFLKKH